MADAAKHALPVNFSDFKRLFSFHKTRKTVAFLYGFMFTSVVVTVFFAFSPSPNSAAPWLTNVFSIGSAGENGGPSSDYRSQVSSIFSHFFPNSSSSSASASPATLDLALAPVQSENSSRSDSRSRTASGSDSPAKRGESSAPVPSVKQSVAAKNQTVQSSSQLNQTRSSSSLDKKSTVSKVNQTVSSGNSEKGKGSESKQSLSDSGESKASKSNQTANLKPVPPKLENKTVSVKSPANNNQTASSPKSEKISSASNQTVNSPKSEKSLAVNQTVSSTNGTSSGVSVVKEKKVEDPLESLSKCDLFDGKWVKDDSYGLYYKPGSCSLIDEQFNCVANGRPDLDFQKFKWKPKGCSLPRLDGNKMLEMLRGKRLVFVGDSLNRNMWESLICILKNSAKDPNNVYEAHGRRSFRAEASYSFVFKDYGFTIEFFVTPFLVQEWSFKDKNGTKKETLRVDMMSKFAVDYKNADVIVFNTGHWWTHDKTSKGEDYYQEGDTVYKELNVRDAFRKAMSSWGKWVDANINPAKSLVFFRGYSHSHFSGGQWNSGGACDSETVPINNETYLRPYIPKMKILEEVLSKMKTDVTYLNVTKMTDFRKDGHPSIYRRQNTPEEELKSPLKYQDCSHWCLPGVPDTWNEVLYAKLLVKFGQKGKKVQQ